MSVAIIDYGAGNIGSIKYALDQCNKKSHIVINAEDLENVERIILPGVGSFNQAMSVLRERQLDVAIKKAVLERKASILGICLGMQIFATKGHEGGHSDGLNLIPGTVCLLQATQYNVRLPHVGWNEIVIKKNYPIFKYISSGSDFYFTHSYHFIAQSEEAIGAVVHYGSNFAAVVLKDNIVGVQFHPEKSGKLGRQLLMNFLSLGPSHA